MFYEMKSINEIESASLISASIPQLSEMLARGDYLGWLVEQDEKVIAGGGVIMRRLLPRPGSPQGGEEAYILNVYTEPQHRRRGLARKIMETILTWCRERSVARVTLHPSDEGEPLYCSLGFERTKEMLWGG
jgi:GNAT superfamily N-acetyltransferase